MPVELGRWLLLWTEMSSMAVGEGYRATELEIMARDAAARRAAIDELVLQRACDMKSQQHQSHRDQQFMDIAEFILLRDSRDGGQR